MPSNHILNFKLLLTVGLMFMYLKTVGQVMSASYLSCPAQTHPIGLVLPPVLITIFTFETVISQIPLLKQIEHISMYGQSSLCGQRMGIIITNHE